MKRCLLLLLALSGIILAPASATTTLTELQFKNHLGNNENIHPKVLYFKDGWNGYKFWMAYTPYPASQTGAENPCIAVSQDGLNWSPAKNLEEVLDSAPEVGYNSDTHLVYRADKDQLECWYRAVDDPAHADCFKRRINTGKGWGPIEIPVPWNYDENNFRVSPVVNCFGDQYELYYVKRGQIYRKVSKHNFDTSEWSEPKVINIEFPKDLLPWHLDMTPSPKEGWYDTIIQAYPSDLSNNNASLYYCLYNPETDESTPIQLLLAPDGIENSRHGRGIYRSSLVYTENEQFLYVTGVPFNIHRYMFVAHGKNLLQDLLEEAAGFAEVIIDGESVETNGNVLSSSTGKFIEVFGLDGIKIGEGLTVTVPNSGLYIVRSKGSIHKIGISL